MKRSTLILLVLLSMIGSSTLFAQQNNRLQLPSIPATLTVPADRAAYLVEHYWDNCNLGDKVLLDSQKGNLEQFFVDFVYIMSHANEDAQRKGVENLFINAAKSAAMYKELMRLTEKYLYEPNSPLLNEEHYIVFLNVMVNGKVLSETEKTRLRYQLKDVNKNRPGTRATNFSYQKAEGGTTTLFETAAGRETMLFFYDADCEHCDEVIEKMKNDAKLKQEVSSGKLTVIAICIAGTPEHWRAHLSKIPANWKKGYAEPLFHDNKLYSIRAFPTVYRLDRNQKVIQKDMRM